MQCRRCQRFGHSVSNCDLEYRCVKCREEHEPGECKAASYRGCPKAKKIADLKDRAKDSAQKQTARVIANPAFLKKGVSFATLVSGKPAARPQQHLKPSIQPAAKKNLVDPDYFKISNRSSKMANYGVESRNIDLKIVSLNVNSLVSNYKRLALNNFLDCHNADIVMLNETKLNDKHVLYFENYNLIRDDRIRGIGGGTAIIEVTGTLGTRPGTMLQTMTEAGDQLKTESFPSDHEAVIGTIRIYNKQLLESPVAGKVEHIYSKINIRKFQKILSKFNLDISPYCNLSPEEILAKLNSINSNIISAMDVSSPERRAYLRYLRKGSNQNLQNDHLISNLSNMIAAIRRNLMFKSEKSVANFWVQRITAIDPRKPGKMFSEINKIFRSKQQQNSSKLKFEASRASLLVEAGIDIQLLEKDVNGCSII
ncbi:hypothetical protein M0802_015898 [Mischocyttarus mexicanus]|nr:hypothetical protein M0802_015898 [Mischocyttarus mexicanus]